MAVALDDAEELVAEHQALAAFGGHAEAALGDLAVRAADAHLERPQQELARGRARIGQLGDRRGAAFARSGDEAQHAQAAVRPPSITNAVPVTNAASFDAR